MERSAIRGHSQKNPGFRFAPSGLHETTTRSMHQAWTRLPMLVIPGRCESIEPGISRFRVQPCGLPRNDGDQQMRLDQMAPSFLLATVDVLPDRSFSHFRISDGASRKTRFCILAAGLARGFADRSRPPRSEGAGNAGRPMRPIAACAMLLVETHTR